MPLFSPIQTHMIARLALLACMVPALIAAAPKPGSGPLQARSQGVEQTSATYPLEQLAGVLGELHALAFACQGSGAQSWRRRMEEMLSLEAPDGAMRQRLISRFNEGFRQHQQRRTRCGAETEMEAQRLALQGQALSETLRRNYAD
ncbi:MAG: TIGR02301 family protein [Caulobacterales bacterium]|uniref:TIGR02301 family protein n=1 Tax=Glycocaulis sp. TaxID=1969725 RepID=UPI003F9FCF50